MASKFRNPPAFKATGKGWANKIPTLAADANNSNCIFTNLGVPEGDPHHRIYAFVTAVQTDWLIYGTYGQSPAARTWYPRNLQQNELTITGQVGNQYEYDRLVEFVLAHHNISVDKSPNDKTVGTRALDFKLLPYRVVTGVQQGVPQYRYIYRGMHLRGYITGIQAGHQRFINAPTFQVGLRVSYDFLQAPTDLQGELNETLYTNYLGLFGSFYKGPKVKGAAPTEPSGSDGFTPGPGFNQGHNIF